MLFDFILVYIEGLSYLAIFGFISLTHIVPIPEEVILIAVGYLASLGFGNIWKFVIVSFFGIIVADNMAYWIGRKKGEAILEVIADRFRITRSRINETKKFFQNHSGKSVFLSRFLVGFRLFMPYIAGAFELPFLKFFAFNLLGSIIWIPSVIFASFVLSGIFDLYAGFTVLKHWVWISAILIIGFIVGWREFLKN